MEYRTRKRFPEACSQRSMLTCGVLYSLSVLFFGLILLILWVVAVQQWYNVASTSS